MRITLKDPAKEIDVRRVHSEDLELRRSILYRAHTAINSEILTYTADKARFAKACKANSLIVKEMGIIDRELWKRKNA